MDKAFSLDFHEKTASHVFCFFFLPPLFFRCFMCGRLPAPDLAALQTSTDVSGGRLVVVVGVCRITFHRRGPREQARLSLCHLAQCGLLSRTPSPSSLPQPPGPSLRQNYKGPPTAGSSLCPPSFSQTQPPLPPPSALPLLDSDTASTAGVL